MYPEDAVLPLPSPCLQGMSSNVENLYRPAKAQHQTVERSITSHPGILAMLGMQNRVTYSVETSKKQGEGKCPGNSKERSLSSPAVRAESAPRSQSDWLRTARTWP